MKGKEVRRMTYEHAMYAPYKIGDKVKVIKEGPLNGQEGVVTSRDPEDAFRAQDCTYGVTLDGETEERKSFDYWDLEPLPRNK
jgi:hypothetical protein